MSYLTFNEGVFEDIKDKVVNTAGEIKDKTLNVAGHVLGTIKNGAIRLKDLASGAAEGIHTVGNKIGAKGFEDDTKASDLHDPIKIDDIKKPDIKIPDVNVPNLDRLNVKGIFKHSGVNELYGNITNRDKEADKAWHNLKNLGNPEYNNIKNK